VNDSTKAGWGHLKKDFGVKQGFDILIANPPWGIDLEDGSGHIARTFAVGKGQYDSSDIFVELALSVVRPGGLCALILPDSIFSLERVELRKMLLTRTEIKFIGRLGEGIFKNVFRGCVVLICRNSGGISRKSNSDIDCLRLTPDIRDRILNDKMNFDSAYKSLSHKVPQQRFLDNEEYRLDLDVRSDERTTLTKITRHQSSLSDYISSWRGVELSKNGKVIRCKECGVWMPLPKSSIHTCTHCGIAISVKETDIDVIVHNIKQPGCNALVVGESIRRYCCEVKRWIDTTKNGINYKKKHIYLGSKIVVRKTGVGITASIDYSNALTNQVVYIYKLNEHVNCTTLEFILAVMNSRAIYYYMAKSYGETEWRSHPYVTQKQILKMPIPKIERHDAVQQRIINRVTALIKPYLERREVPPVEVDAEVELLISDFYGLSVSDYEKIYATIDSVQDLLPVKAIKNVNIYDIFSEGKSDK